ncbi:outer membrane beta-barrel protein [Maritalea mediterranea]|uniref:Outer membrane beta-barrel protein n=1 Tax=Maritalea mediterranea TaxID=2909667 RepID=A0ABS9E9Z5_9HYPH|nr:outer membrane beta-barrel protein [Maritalea mediterranea]MCF4099583.1 outer membrane beta-barrel protein [Maritalea mediterranea]
MTALSGSSAHHRSGWSDGWRLLICAGSVLVWAVASHQTALAEDLLYPFDLSTSLSLRGGYEMKDGVGQSYLEAVPQISATRVDEDWVLSGSASATLDQYQKEGGGVRTLNLDAAVSYQLSRRTSVDAGIDYGLNLPRLNSDDLPDTVSEAPLNQTFGANASLAHQFNKTALDGRLGLRRTQTGPTRLDDDSLQDNSDQNAWAWSVGGRVSRELTPIVNVFYDTNVTRTIYDAASATLSAKRDGWTFDNRLGVAVNFKDRVTGEVSVGQLRRAYDAPGLNTVLTTSYGAAITYQLGNSAVLTVSADTSLSPATESGEADKITDGLSLGFSQQVNDRWGYELSTDFGREHYQGSDRHAGQFALGLEAIYIINSYASAYAGYRYELSEDSVEGGSRTNAIEAGLRFTRP